MMGKLFKLVLFLIVVSIVAIIGFAYLGDLSPQQTDIRQPVTLDVN